MKKLIKNHSSRLFIKICRTGAIFIKSNFYGDISIILCSFNFTTMCFGNRNKQTPTLDVQRRTLHVYVYHLIKIKII